MLPSNNGGKAQSILSYVILGLLGFGTIKVLNSHVFPDLIWFLENLWMTALLGGGFAVTAYTIISNRTAFWMLYQTLISKLIAFFVKMDPLSVMDRYVEFLEQKLTNLNETINVLQGKNIKISRKIAELDSKMNEAINYGKAAITQQDQEQAGVYGSRLQNLRQSKEALLPIAQQLESSLIFLNRLSKNWGTSIVKLKDEIDIKREHFETVKATMGGLESAQEYINGGTEAGKLYGMSLKALEESLTQKMGYILEFEKKAAPMMKQIALEETANTQEGLRQLEAMFDNKLLLPTEFSQKQTVPVKVSVKTENKFNL